MEAKVTSREILKALSWRYATKYFSRTAKISEEDWEALEECLVLAPSSYGLQPWKFVVITSADLRTRLRPHTRNQFQPEDCSHYVVFCAREKISEEDIDRLIKRTVEVRGGAVGDYLGLKNMILSDVVTGLSASKAFEYASRQCHIALGILLTAAALMGIDTCPIAGFMPEKYDEVLGLTGTGWKSVVCCALGYRDPSDKYRALKKVRFNPEVVIDRR